MILKHGFNHISYQILSRTKKGREQWDKLIKQVTEIALQHHNHFFDNTARKTIPGDAQRHRFYAYFRDEHIIDAFLVATIKCGQAELLWGSCRNFDDPQMRIDLMNEFYDKIEHDLFINEEVSKIYGLSCTKDTEYTNEYNEKMLGTYWIKSHEFHENRNYSFTHRLEDFWEEGSHAFVFTMHRKQYVKSRKAFRYGYSEFNFVPKLTLSTLLEDNNLALNNLIYKQISKYLDVFDEYFVTSASPKNIKNGISIRLQGFTGIGFFDINEGVVTLFARPSSPEPSEEYSKYHFQIDSSAITQLLASDLIKQNHGILYYPAEWDESQSELKICQTYAYYKKKPQVGKEGSSKIHLDNYTIFYAKWIGSDDHMSVLYFVTEEIENVVWYKPIWEAFATYSFALILDIYSYFSSLKLLQPELRDNDYFDYLLKAVSPKDQIISDNRFYSLIAWMKDDIRERIRAHFKAEIQGKSMALVHLGHSLTHRVSTVCQYFDAFKPKEDDLIGRVASKNSELIRDVFMLIQAVNIYGLKELLAIEHDKRKKFLLEIPADSPSYALEEIINDCRLIASTIREQKYQEIKDNYWVELNIISADLPNLKLASLDLNSLPEKFKSDVMSSLPANTELRMNHRLLTPIITELFDNISKHGEIDSCDSSKVRLVDSDGKERCYNKLIKEVYVCYEPIGNDLAITFTNSIKLPANHHKLLKDETINGEKSVGYLIRSEEWKAWPRNINHSGPGLSIDALRQIGLGDMYYRMELIQEGEIGFWFQVGFTFRGLYLEKEKGNG